MNERRDLLSSRSVGYLKRLTITKVSFAADTISAVRRKA
jgi:hypothetical protein